MPAYKQIYDAADAVLQDFAINVSQDGGTTYGPATFHIWNDKGGLHGDATTLVNARVRAMVSNGLARVSSGFPIEDEAWTQMAIVGFSNAGDPNFAPQSSGFKPIGSNNPFLLPNVPKNCSIYIQVKIVVPAGISANITQELYLEIVDDEASVPTALRIGALLGPGIIPDWIDLATRRVRRGFGITTSGGATIDVADGSFVYDGKPANVIKVTLALNQNDGLGNALTAGQSYIAVISLPSSGVAHATKGIRSAGPAAPAVPANEILVGYVTVTFQGGGISVINAGNVDQSGLIYGEYLVTMKTGLNVNVGAGLAITATDTETFNSATATVGVADNVANQTVWLRPEGTFSVSLTSPAVGAIALAFVSAAAGVVTSITDVRAFVGRAINEVQVVLKYYGPPVSAFPGNPQTSLEILTDAWALLSLAPSRFVLDSVDFEFGSLGAGASGGNFKADVFFWNPGVSTATGPATIYANSGTQDLRPTIAYNAASCRSVGNRGHEVNIFQSGTRFGAQIVELPTGVFTTESNDWFIVLHFRKM